MSAPKRILYVRFAGDNDFRKTVKAFVEAIAPRVLLGDFPEITKEDIVMLFNKHAYSLYELHQRHTISAEEEGCYQKEPLRDYLQIEIKDVYFDDEAKEFTNYNSDGCMAVLEHDGIEYYIM